jgi:hypothetical protein
MNKNNDIVKDTGECEKVELKNSDDDGNNNLSDNKISTEIEPHTYGNNVNVSLCSCTMILSCIIS